MQRHHPRQSIMWSWMLMQKWRNLGYIFYPSWTDLFEHDSCDGLAQARLLIYHWTHSLEASWGLFQLQTMSFPGDASSKEPACQCRRHRRLGFDLWVGKIPWRKAWQPTPVFLLGESHGQKNLADYSPQGRTESDMTEATYQAILLLLASLEHMIISQQVSYSRT